MTEFLRIFLRAVVLTMIASIILGFGFSVYTVFSERLKTENEWRQACLNGGGKPLKFELTCVKAIEVQP